MPTAKTADAAATKKKKSSRDKGVKEKKEKSVSSSKEREKSDKKESSRKKKSSPDDDNDKPPKPSPSPSSQPQPLQTPYDADAVQLFRRYDRARTGVLLRCDFLQLLRDYAHPSSHPHRQLAPRLPLSLTDSQGVPLGYERSDKNSEFEAGQLFERYDKDHAGTLSMDKFLVFFNDFRTQLRGFVDDLSYAGAPPATTDVSPNSQRDSTSESETRLPQPARPTTPVKLPTTVRAEYQATLWEVRKICKEELHSQRERIMEEMDRLRARMASSPHATPSPRSPRSREDPFAFRLTRSKASVRDNQLVDRYDALESDGERVDEILRLARRQLRKGMDVSTKEMEEFLDRAPGLMTDARELAMKAYEGHGFGSWSRRREESEEKDPYKRQDSPRRTMPVHPPEREKDKQADERPSQSAEELQKTLRIKDQIIYQLLQERTTLRKQKSVAETELHDLTEMSTHEMRKWAQLTDDMQAEIARLRERLEFLDGR